MRLSNEHREIAYNVVNSLLAGALVFLGACTDGSITKESIIAAGVASLAVAITQFKKYWDSESSDYKHRKVRKKAQLFAIIG